MAGIVHALPEGEDYVTPCCGKRPNDLPSDSLTPFGPQVTCRPEGDEPDLVNHPPHYTAHPSGVECIEITEHMGFNVGNAVKYLWRADEKGNALEDLRKAEWYVRREIARREGASA